MTSIKVKVKAELDPAHHMVTVWAGPSAEHRAACGVLTMTPEESAELIARVDAGELDLSEITPEVAAHVLFHFGQPGGYPASGFKTTLLLALAQADVINRALLARGFPGYARAFNLAQNTETGTERLQQIAGRES